MSDYNRNPKGLGGFRSGEGAANPGGRPRGASTIQLRCLRYCGEAVDTLRDIMRKNEGSKSDALRMAAANAILDRGVGRAAQSVALDLNLTQKLDQLSDDELVALRDRYAALTTAAPAMLEHLAEQEEMAPDLFIDADDDRRD